MRATGVRSVASGLFLALIILVKRIRPSISFFTALPLSQVETRSWRRTGKTIARAAELDPSDPYYNLVKNYQKKGSPTVTNTLSAPTLPSPPKVVELESPVEGTTASSSDAISTVSPLSAESAVPESIDSIPSVDVTDVGASTAASVTSATAAPKITAAASSGTGTSAATGKAMPLFQYVLTNFPGKRPPLDDTGGIVATQVSDQSQFNALENAKDKLDVIKNNFFGGPQHEIDLSKVSLPKVSITDLPIPETTKSGVLTLEGNAKPAMEALEKVAAPIKSAVGAAASAGVAGAAAASGPGGFLSMDNVVDNLKEYGSWYIAGIAVLFGAAQRSAGRDEARIEFEAKLEVIKKQANDAADAAEAAAAGARKAQQMAARGMTNKEGTDSDFILEKTRMQHLQVEKDIIQKEMQELKDDNMRLKGQLHELSEALSASAVQSVGSEISLEFSEEDEEIYDEHMSGDIQQEEEDNAKIIAAIKEIDEANKVRRAAEKKVIAEKARLKMLAEEKERLQAAAEEERRKAAAEEARIKAEIKAKEQEKAIAAKSKQKRGKGEKRASVKRGRAVQPESAVSQVVAPKRGKVIVAHSTVKKAAHPWSSLAASTLGRKTVAELSSFLDERGVPARDDSGKSLRKKELLAKVQQLL